MENTAIRHEIIISVLGGLLGAMISLLMLSSGITLSPDGWAYWESSVPIIEGKGYQYFGGNPIIGFPPIFTLYLSSVQKFFGVSGYSLIGSVVTLAAVTSFIWVYLLIKLTRNAPNSIIYRLLGMFYISSFVGTYFTSLLSETLFLTLLGFSFLLLTRIGLQVSYEEKSTWTLLLICLVATAMLLTRNLAITLLPGLGYVIFMRYGTSSKLKRIVVSTGIMVIPFCLWFLTRLYLGQLGSHPLSYNSKYAPGEYLDQLFIGLAYMFGPSQFYIGQVILLAIVALSGFLILYHRKSNISPISDATHIATIASIALLGIFILFNLTWIHDPLSGRYIWFLPLSFFTILAVTAAHSDNQRFAVIPMIVLIVITMLQVQRTGEHVWNRLQSSTEPNVLPHYTISPDHIAKPTLTTGDKIIVAPPDFKWIDRNFER